MNGNTPLSEPSEQYYNSIEKDILIMILILDILNKHLKMQCFRKKMILEKNIFMMKPKDSR